MLAGSIDPLDKGTAPLPRALFTTSADRRLTALVGLVVLSGAASVLLSGATIAGLVGGPDIDHPPWHWLLFFTVLVFLGDRLNVPVRIRSTRTAVAWTDTVILLGLVIMPAPWVVVATAVGVAIGRATRRLRAAQLLFGPAKDATTAFLGGLVLLGHATESPGDAITSVGWYALAFAVMTAIDLVLAVPVIALASRTRILDRLKANWDIRVITLLGRFVIVVTAIVALQLQPVLLYLLPAVILIAHLWHQRWVRAREERQAWQHLAAATEAFSEVDLDVVLHAAVTHGTALFSADELEVEIWPGLRRRLVRGGERVTFDGDPADAPADDRNVYAVALHGYPGRRDIGALRLRFRDRIKISEREQAILSSYAASLDTAIRNAAAYGQLGEATAAHAHAAAHDPLTGLANRRELERHLTEALATESGLDCRVALMLLDLKHFKEVNDTLGHLAGDRVLVQIAQRLADAVRPRDLVARFGGDEFAVLLRSAYRPERVETRAAGVLAALTEPVTVDGLPIVVEANAGLALAVDPQDEPADLKEDAAAPEDAAGRDRDSAGPAFRATAGTWMAELMRRADVAMYQAKRRRRALMSYSPLADTADRHRLALAGELSKAVAERQFVLRFQPIVDLATGRVHGAEALARWRHPTRGQLEPRWFLDLIERSNHLQEFTAAVLDDALCAADTWRAAGHDLVVSVNVSARSLLDAGLPRMVLDALDRHRTPPQRLCLELTETLAISQLDTVDEVLTRLHDIGVRLSLDDFGTGYSSLAALSRIPVHQLKVDRSFVRVLRDMYTDVDDGPDAEAITQARAVVRSTVQLGRTLELSVVAEGVESVAQRRLLWQLGCSYGQGHLFTRPVPAHGLLEMLTRGVGGRPGTLAEPLHDDAKVVPLPRPRSARDGSPADRPH